MCGLRGWLHVLPCRVGQSNKNIDQRGETLLPAQPGTLLQEPFWFFLCIIGGSRGKLRLSTTALSGEIIPKEGVGIFFPPKTSPVVRNPNKE